jgi:hypothetical protein
VTAILLEDPGHAQLLSDYSGAHRRGLSSLRS